MGIALIYLLLGATASLASADSAGPSVSDSLSTATAAVDELKGTAEDAAGPVVSDLQERTGTGPSKPPEPQPPAEEKQAPEVVTVIDVTSVADVSVVELPTVDAEKTPPSLINAVAEYLAGAVKGALQLLASYKEASSGDPSAAAAAVAVAAQAVVVALAETAAVQVLPFAVFTGATLASENPLGRDPKRWLAPLLAPLYTRLEKSELLDHEVRELLHRAIDTEPGVTIAELVARSGVSRNAVSYHLRVMEKQGLVTSRRLGRTVHLFINGARFEEPVKAAVSVLKNGTTMAIGQYIREHPGSPQRELCDAFEITPGAANWHIRKLEDKSLVTRERDGRVMKYFPGHVWEQMQVPVQIAGAA